MNLKDELLGDSPGIEAVRKGIERLLQRSANIRSVLIQGETGTGKGLVARALHRAGPRAGGPFVDVNCAAIPETLLEAEMFGFERGAFTDARQAKPGLFQTAHRGTLFLDEIGALPESLQAKLLKVIEDRTVRRLGSTRSEPVDVWIVAATSVDLLGATRDGRFRPDLYHRLAIFTIWLPPLRERGQDIVRLAEHFLARACADHGLPAKQLSADACDSLMGYPWPGNVRELSNALERAALLADEQLITAAILALPIGQEAPDPRKTTGARASATHQPAHEQGSVSMDDAVRAHVSEVLAQTGWNLSRAAALLGIARNTLHARIRKYGLQPPAPRQVGRAAGGMQGHPATPAAERVSLAEPKPAAPRSSFGWERRLLAFLRVSLSVSGDTAAFQVTPILDDLIAKAKSFGGHIEELTPLGTVAMFGVDPVENATSHAAHAALAIVKGVERAQAGHAHGVTATCAIHSSWCLIARNIDVIGMDPADRQAVSVVLDRLIQSAEPDTVVVDDAAARFIQRRLELEAVKMGSGSPVGMYRVVGRERTGFEVVGRGLSRFVGRESELELLWSRLESALRGQGQIVGISGEAGIGKSRLVYEFRQSLSGKPVVYLEGQCVSYGTATPYLPVLDVLKTSCGITDADAAETVGERVEAALREVGMDPAAAGPYLLHLLGIKEGAERLQALEPDAIKARIFETLRHAWLGRSRQHPLVLVLEDLHWIDSTSEELFASLAEILAGSQVFLVCTYRSGYRPPWIEKSYATQVALQPLAPDDSLRMLRSVLGTEPVPDVLADRIVSKAEGNPLFLEELARTVRERAGDSPALAVPDTIQEVLRGRIERLAPDDKRLLEVAAVVGRDVPLAIVQAIADLPEDAVRAGFARLKSADFLYETSPGPEIEYTFKHALTHEVAYGSLLDDARHALHARIVEAIERRHPDRLVEQVERLAHHAVEGRAWRKAMTYLHEAGLKAFRRCAHREAVTCFEQALVALAHVPEGREKTAEAIDLRFELRNALQPLGEFGRILESLRDAEALARSLGDQRRLGQASAFLADYSRLMGDQDRALEYGRQALALAETLGDFVLQVRTNTYLGQTCHVRGDYRGAVQFLEKNVAALEDGREHDSLGFPQLPSVHSRTCLVWCLAELGDFAEGIRRGEEAVRISESSNHPFTLATAYAGIGSLHVRRGDVLAAIPILEHGLELCRSWNLSLWFPRIASSLGEGLTLAGRLAEALPLLEEAVERSAAMQVMGGHAPVLASLGAVYLLAGRPADAGRLAAQALALARAHKEQGHEAWALRLEGEIALRSDSRPPAVARERLEEALTLASELDMRPLVAHSRAGLGRFSRRSGVLAEAREHWSAAAALYSRMGMTLWLREAEAALGELH